MAEPDSAGSERENIKDSIAWGQLLVGSVLAGLGVWKLFLKVNETSVSDALAGLAAAYGEVRDFVLSPFAWFGWPLSEAERDGLTVSIVMLGALIRAMVRHPLLVRPFLGSLATGGLVIAGIEFLRIWRQPGRADALWTYLTTAGPITLIGWTLFFVSILIPTMMWEGKAARVHSLVLLSIIATVACGVVLLLLNWATS